MSEAKLMRCPGEGEDKCLWCLPLGCALKTEAVLLWLGGASMILNGVQIMDLFMASGVLTIVSGVCTLLVALKFLGILKGTTGAGAEAAKACILGMIA